GTGSSSRRSAPRRRRRRSPATRRQAGRYRCTSGGRCKAQPHPLMETTFYGIEFLTRPGRVFTPRVTTEALVDAALAHIEDAPKKVADVGTGAGVIGVA